jgi:hypothetical protein
MKKLNKFWTLLLLITLTQCVVTKKQKNRFLEKYCTAKDSVAYVYKDSIVFVDTTIQVPYIVNEPIYLENPCSELCDSLGRLKKFHKTTSNKGLKSTVHSVGNSIVFKCETDSLKARIKWLEHYITTQSNTVTTKYVACTSPHQTKFTGFTFWWFLFTALLIVIYLGLRALASYIKFK